MQSINYNLTSPLATILFKEKEGGKERREGKEGKGGAGRGRRRGGPFSDLQHSSPLIGTQLAISVETILLPPVTLITQCVGSWFHVCFLETTLFGVAPIF